MTVVNPNPDEIKALLKNAKRIAIVGLSDQPERDSYEVANYLLSQGYEIIPVNPRVTEVFGIKSVSSLAEIEGHVDVVNVFRRPEFLYEIAEETAEIGADIFWSQLGLVDGKAYDFLKLKGITTVMDRCIKIEHMRLSDGW